MDGVVAWSVVELLPVRWLSRLFRSPLALKTGRLYRTFCVLKDLDEREKMSL